MLPSVCEWLSLLMNTFSLVPLSEKKYTFAFRYLFGSCSHNLIKPRAVSLKSCGPTCCSVTEPFRWLSSCIIQQTHNKYSDDWRQVRLHLNVDCIKCLAFSLKHRCAGVQPQKHSWLLNTKNACSHVTTLKTLKDRRLIQ